MYILLFIPHFLCTHCGQLLHCIELLPTALSQTPHGHLTAFSITFCHFPLIITLALLIFTLIPLFFTISFHSFSLLIRSPSVSAITMNSSAYNNSHHKATLNPLDKASMTIKNSKGLNLSLGAYRRLPQIVTVYIMFLQLFLQQYT